MIVFLFFQTFYLPVNFNSIYKVIAFILYLAPPQTESCRAPLLPNGFFVPAYDQYPHGQNLTYTCFRGSKPAVDVWWVTITCLNGNWNQKPECIGEFKRAFYLMQTMINVY